jgi:hypothetical protein
VEVPTEPGGYTSGYASSFEPLAAASITSRGYSYISIYDLDE